MFASSVHRYGHDGVFFDRNTRAHLRTCRAERALRSQLALEETRHVFGSKQKRAAYERWSLDLSNDDPSHFHKNARPKFQDIQLCSHDIDYMILHRQERRAKRRRTMEKNRSHEALWLRTPLPSELIELVQSYL